MSAATATVARPILAPNFDGIPAQLRLADQWLCWHARWKPDGRLDKPPCRHDTGRICDAHAPANWGTFDQARTGYERHQLSGVGFDLTEHDPYAVADLDHCGRLDAAGNFTFTDPGAEAIVAALNSRTELTPSAEGLRVWVRGQVPAGRCKVGNIEFYDHKRYVTVTGRHLAGTPTTIEPRQAELEAVCAEYLGAGGQANEPKPRPAAAPVDMGDAELIERMCSARNGAKAARLLAGDTADYGGDESAADLAFCNVLAFWSGRDAARMDRLFRQSGLMRDKWDSKRGDSTYGRWTIDRAIAKCRETYTPSWADPAIDDLLAGVSTAPDLTGDTTAPTGQVVLSDLAPEVAAHIARLEQEKRELGQRADSAQANLHACREQWAALRALMRDTDLDAAYKLVLIGRLVLRAEQQHRGKAEEDGSTPEPAAWVAERVGMSERRVRDKMDAQDAAGLFTRHKHKWQATCTDAVTGVITEEPRQVYHVRPCTGGATMAPLLRLAITQKPPAGMPGAGKKEGHGGKRVPSCPQHPLAGTIEEVTGLYEHRATKCATCRRVLAETQQRVDQQPLQQPAPAPDLGARLGALFDRAEGTPAAPAETTGQVVLSPESEPEVSPALPPVDYLSGQDVMSAQASEPAAPSPVPTPAPTPPTDASPPRQDAPRAAPAAHDGMWSVDDYDAYWGTPAPPARAVQLTLAGGGCHNHAGRPSSAVSAGGRP